MHKAALLRMFAFVLLQLLPVTSALTEKDASITSLQKALQGRVALFIDPLRFRFTLVAAVRDER
jgi:hypothetical protein